MNGLYLINDPYALFNQVGDLQQVSNDILRVRENLISQCELISNAWTSSTVDRESYLRNIYNNLERVNNLISAISMLSNELTELGRRSLEISQTGM